MRPGARLMSRWRQLAPRTRGLMVFAVFNVLALNLLLYALPWTPDGLTTLHYARDFVTRLPTGGDSWVPMRLALEHLDHGGREGLYEQLFFSEQVKFQYPPSSLLLLEPQRRLAGGELVSNKALNLLSWLAMVLTAAVVARLAILSRSQPKAEAAEVDPWLETLVTISLALVLTLAFYPLQRAYRLGQIQTWLNALLALSVWAWVTGRRSLTGVLVGLITLVKPQLALLVLWAVLRRQWKFLAALVGTVGALGTLSLSMYGLRNHLGYLDVLSFISRRGEIYYANQSVNGLLNRIFTNRDNLIWDPRGFAPYDPRVFFGTLVSSALIVIAALVWKRSANTKAEHSDFLIAVLSFTIASPIAWDHHYGVLMPIFAVTLAAIAALPRAPRWAIPALAVSYLLSSNFYGISARLAPTTFNFLQSYQLFGALLLLLLLYWLRGAQKADPAAPADQA